MITDTATIVKDFIIQHSDSVLTIIISTGLLSLWVKFLVNKKIQSYELKLQKYSKLGEELGKLVSNNADWDKLCPLLNQALIFASDEVASEVLKFNSIITTAKQNSLENGEKTCQITGADIVPLMKQIRKDLSLKSKKIDKQEFRFFMKPVKSSSDIVDS